MGTFDICHDLETEFLKTKSSKEANAHLLDNWLLAAGTKGDLGSFAGSTKLEEIV